MHPSHINNKKSIVRKFFFIISHSNKANTMLIIKITNAGTLSVTTFGIILREGITEVPGILEKINQ